MQLSRTLRSRRDGLIITPWRDQPEVAHMVALRPPGSDRLARVCGRLARSGFRRVITGALGPNDQGVFLRAGFESIDELCLLSVSPTQLQTRAAESNPTPRADRESAIRTRRWGFSDVIALDNVAFPEFWQLTGSGLNAARRATPVSRLTVVGPRPCVGYALTGRSGRMGYLQRLAVHPDMTGHGHGRALVVDAINWLHQRNVTQVLVNTQVGNTRALDLYESLGFAREPHGLSVLALDLPPAG